ncbi:MAG: ankyrin repeat domain-containing protein, partial [Aphanocapsa feldmannii 277cV]
SAGSQLDASDKDGFTLLHLAAEVGQVESIKELLRAGAQLDARNDIGSTPLHVAAQQGQVESIKELL